MSDSFQHRDGSTVEREEHAVDGGVTRKRVGLFAKDGLGDGVLELSAISTASGAVLSTTPATISSTANLGNVTLNPSPNHIGSVTIFGTVQSTPGMTTLFGGPNQIGSVTISNIPQVDIRSALSLPTLNVVTQAITVNSGMLTIFPGPNQIGSVTVSNTVPVSQSGNWSNSLTGLISLASGTEVRSLATVLNFPATQAVSFGLVSLASGTEVRSLATILNFPATQPVSFGLVSLASGTEVRVRQVTTPWEVSTSSLPTVSIGNIPSVDVRSILSAPTLNVVTQALTVNSGMVTLFPGPNQIGSVTIANTVPVTGSFWQATQPVSFGLVSLASGTEVRSLATVLNFPATQAVSQSGSWDLRSVLSAATIFAVVNTGNSNSNVTLNPSPNFIGLVTVANTVPVSGTFWQATQPVSLNQLISLASGTEVRSLATVMNFPAVQAVSQNGTWNVGINGLTSLASGTEIRSLATILNFPATQAVTQSGSWDLRSVLSAATIFAVVNTGASNSNVTLNPSPNYIGLVTTYQGRSATTLFAGYVSASGYSTIFTPPSGQRFFIHSVLVNSKGVSDGFIGSSTNPMIPWTSLATYGGFPYQHETPGLIAPATDQALTIRQYSLVTISYTISTHFE